jgi:regulator of replication initiation timing
MAFNVRQKAMLLVDSLKKTFYDIWNPKMQPTAKQNSIKMFMDKLKDHLDELAKEEPTVAKKPEENYVADTSAMLVRRLQKRMDQTKEDDPEIDWKMYYEAFDIFASAFGENSKHGQYLMEAAKMIKKTALNKMNVDVEE